MFFSLVLFCIFCHTTLSDPVFAIGVVRSMRLHLPGWTVSQRVWWHIDGDLRRMRRLQGWRVPCRLRRQKGRFMYPLRVWQLCVGRRLPRSMHNMFIMSCWEIYQYGL